MCWEYKELHLVHANDFNNLSTCLANLGKEKWELVTTIMLSGNQILIFKRGIELNGYARVFKDSY